jgi:phosphopantetheine--protein transferase-like protein
MPLFYQQNINATTKMAIWSITEPLDFFEQKVSTNVQINHPLKKIQHLSARLLLQYLLPNVDTASIKYATNGKPYLENNPHHFSVSHCKGYAACIISSLAPVGIDIEIIHERVGKVAHQFLHHSELEKIMFLKEEEQLKQMTFFWAAKEAMYKMNDKLGINFAENLILTQVAKLNDSVIPAAILGDTVAVDVKIHYHIASEFVWAACVV